MKKILVRTVVKHAVFLAELMDLDVCFLHKNVCCSVFSPALKFVHGTFNRPVYNKLKEYLNKYVLNI